MPRTEVCWTRDDEEGGKRQVCAHRQGDRWLFFARSKRYDDWLPVVSPPLEDWLELLDGVRRRIGRGLTKSDDEGHLRRRIRELFPGADVD